MSLSHAALRVRPLLGTEGQPVSGRWRVEVGVCGVWRELPTTAVDIALRPGEPPKVTFSTIRAGIVIEPTIR